MKHIASIYEVDNGYIITDEQGVDDDMASTYVATIAEAVSDVEGMLIHYAELPDDDTALSVEDDIPF